MVAIDRYRERLAGRTPRTLPLDDLRPAAVLLPLFWHEGEEHILFTLRTDNLPHHAGEISFPGGALDPEDATLLDAALRESEEEMGINPADVTIVGQLDDFISVHGYRVTPFVGTIPYPYPFRVNLDEIAEVIELPLRRLRDPAIFSTENWEHRGRRHPVHFYRIDGHNVWGLTAEILRHFLHLVD